MKKYTYAIAVATLLFTAFQTNKNKHNTVKQEFVKKETPSKVMSTKVNFEIAKNYFEKNTVKKLNNPKIDNAEKFNQIFGLGQQWAITESLLILILKGNLLLLLFCPKLI